MSVYKNDNAVDNLIGGFMKAICDAEGIIIDDNFDVRGIKGIAFYESPNGEGIRVIGHNPKLEGWPKISTIAHEIGHHILGHLDDDVMLLDNSNEAYKVEQQHREQEARVFAATFTAIAIFDAYV